MQSKYIRVLPYKKYPATFNMAADEYLLDQKNLINLRFYGWRQKTLSLGHSQKKVAGLHWSFCQQNLELVRRLSGGQAVLHEHELTYSITTDNQLFAGSILGAYSTISQVIQKSLKTLGVSSVFQPQAREVKRCGICFYEPAAYELLVEGKKVVGSAQVRRKNRFLQHGSILWATNFLLWSKIWENTTEQALQARIGSVSTAMPKNANMQHLAEKIAQNLAEQLNLPLQELDFSPTETQQIEDLAQSYKLDWSDLHNVKPSLKTNL